jgi:hypothetical protein
MAEAAFNLADWILLADVGEYRRQKNDGHRGLARGDVQTALEAGCGLTLRWVGDNGREVCREEFFKRDSWEDILVWAGLPQRLCVQLPPDERKGNLPYPYAYLLRADAVRLGLLPASELPQAKQQSERLPQPELAPAADVGDQAGAVTSGETEAPPEPEPEHTRWQRDRTIEAMKALHPPYGIRPKGTSIQALTNRINKLPEFQGNQVSDDTVRLADIEIKAALKK